jgi:transcriptional regulator with XRE-family HTH domain
MIVGTRLRQLREARNLSQGDIEVATGLLRCYTSRVENNHTVPSVGTLEKYARALDIPIHTLFLEEGQKVEGIALEPLTPGEHLFGSSGKEKKELRLFVKALSNMTHRQRSVLLRTAGSMVPRGYVEESGPHHRRKSARGNRRK